jgi:hypothetical protein
MLSSAWRFRQESLPHIDRFLYGSGPAAGSVPGGDEAALYEDEYAYEREGLPSPKAFVEAHSRGGGQVHPAGQRTPTATRETGGSPAPLAACTAPPRSPASSVWLYAYDEE